MSSQTSPLTGSTKTELPPQQQQQPEVVQQRPSTDVKGDKKVESNGNNKSKATSKVEESAPVVRMRTKAPLTQIQQQLKTSNESENGNGTAAIINEANGSSNVVADPRLALQRGLDVLNEISCEDDGSEEIRKLDHQLDHLNHYMDTVEQRIKTHNDKLMDTLKQQKEDRERKRQSFHERVAQSQQEDDDFQRRLSTLMNRVDISKNRASMYDIISHMEVPKGNGD